MTAVPFTPRSVHATGAYLRLELPRTVRNKRYLVLAIGFPVAFYILFTEILAGSVPTTPADKAFFMVSMAVYGGIGAALSGAVRIAMERTNGWTRQLRVTPLPPSGYVAAKLATAYLTAVPSIALVMAAAILINQVSLPLTTWLALFVSLSLGMLAFAALGTAIGYLFDESSAQLVFSILFFALSILGGLFVPVSRFGEPIATIARMLPSYSLGNLGWSALAGDAPHLSDVVSLLAYGLAFLGIVAWRYRADELRARG